jgi:hypothetical protein
VIAFADLYFILSPALRRNSQSADCRNVSILPAAAYTTTGSDKIQGQLTQQNKQRHTCSAL